MGPDNLTNRPPDSTGGRSVLDRWTALTIVAVGVFLFSAAGRYIVFDDEAFSCRRYVMPMGEMVSALWRGVEPDPPLYYLLENLWVRFFGVGPVGLRSLSIIMFLVALPCVRLAGQAWFDRPTGLAAMLLCALHPLHWLFGFAARWYSLMFLASGVLLWLTARLAAVERSDRRLIAAWSLAAAAACYTNYFGLVVACLAWLVGAARNRGSAGGIKRWLWAGAGAVLLYAPWLPAMLGQVKAFPSPQPAWWALAATFARTLTALLAGNLASIAAWWVWVPLGVFGVAAVVLSVQLWSRVWPAAVLTVGCLAAGIVSRTMIDKYVMTFSAAGCLWAAALFTHGLASSRSATVGLWSRFGLAALIVGWAGCSVNLVTQRHWSSLRWLDPFEKVIDDLIDRKDVPPPTRWAMTHPSARYYYGLRMSRQHAQQSGGPKWKADGQSWRRFAEPPSSDLGSLDLACGTPSSVLERMVDEPLPSLLTLETAGFRELADQWGELRAVLDRSYVLVDQQTFLEDPDSGLKDRLDSTIRHPRWRIVVRCWQLAHPADQ
jgi:hypothetical protein